MWIQMLRHPLIFLDCLFSYFATSIVTFVPIVIMTQIMILNGNFDNSADRRVWTAWKCLLRRHLPLHDLHRPLLLPHRQQVHLKHHRDHCELVYFSGPAMVPTFTTPTKPSMTWVRQDDSIIQKSISVGTTKMLDMICTTHVVWEKTIFWTFPAFDRMINMQMGHKIVTDWLSGGFLFNHCCCATTQYQHVHWSRVGVLLHSDVNSRKFDCNDNGNNDENYDVNDADNSYGLVTCGFAGHCTDGQFWKKFNHLQQTQLDVLHLWMTLMMMIMGIFQWRIMTIITIINNKIEKSNKTNEANSNDKTKRKNKGIELAAHSSFPSTVLRPNEHKRTTTKTRHRKDKDIEIAVH